jgi:hypothetical protein
LGYFPLLAGVAVLIGLAVFFWTQIGPGSGRGLGNRVAAHIGLPRGVFYALLENGVKDSARDALLALMREKVGVEDASVRLAPALAKGLERLEARFGPQGIYDDAKPLLARLQARAAATAPTPPGDGAAG